jgi:hypothetical protein
MDITPTDALPGETPAHYFLRKRLRTKEELCATLGISMEEFEEKMRQEEATYKTQMMTLSELIAALEDIRDKLGAAAEDVRIVLFNRGAKVHCGVDQPCVFVKDGKVKAVGLTTSDWRVGAQHLGKRKAAPPPECCQPPLS